MLTTRPYTDDDFESVVGLQLSHWDQTEALDISGASSVRDALSECLECSDNTWVICDPEGVIVGVFGYSTSVTHAIPWMLGADEVHTKYPVSLCRGGLQIAQQWSRDLPPMFNLVWSENTRSIRWLKFLGFSFPDYEPIPVNGRLYIKFIYDTGGSSCVIP